MNTTKLIETPSAVERFLEVLSEVFDRNMTLHDLSVLTDDELGVLSSEKQEEFKALMHAAILTPELMFSPEFNSAEED